MAIFDLLNQNQGALSVVFSLIVALATVFYALLTRSLVAETKKLRRVQTEPKVSVYLRLHEGWFEFMDLVVRNIGNGPAYQVQWAIDRGDVVILGHQKLSEVAILKAITYMAPNQEFRILLGNAYELLRRPNLWPISMKAKYRDQAGNKLSEQFTIDARQFEGIPTAMPSRLQTGRALERISKDLDSICTGSAKLRVLIATEEEERKKTGFRHSPRPPRAYEKWTEEEEATLSDLFRQGRNLRDIAESLGRHRGAVRSRLKKMGRAAGPSGMSSRQFKGKRGEPGAPQPRPP